MGRETADTKGVIQEKASAPSDEVEQEDRYGWNVFYPQLLEQIKGVPSEEGEKALRGLYESWKEIEQLWLQGEIRTPKERSDRRYETGRDFFQMHEELFEQDEAFSEAIAIIRDKTG